MKKRYIYDKNYNMKQKLMKMLKFTGIFAAFVSVYILSLYFGVDYLQKINNRELNAPDLLTLNFKVAEKRCKDAGLQVKKIDGNFDSNYKPLTVIDQTPAPGTRIKEGSVVKLYITSKMVEVIVPDLVGHTVIEAEEIIKNSDLKRRYIAYVDSDTVPVDFLISQSKAAGLKVYKGASVDFLVSKGKREHAFIMPDLIGRKADNVLFQFESLGLRIANITRAPYWGMDPGIITKQFPSSGFRISSKNLISIQVSE